MAFWTNHQVDKLRRWYGSMPIEQIADLLGKSPDAIYSRAYRMGLSRHIDYPDVEETKGLIREGWSHGSMTRKLKIR